MIQRIATQSVGEINYFSRRTTRAVKRIYKTKFKVITQEQDLRDFQNRTYRQLGITYPMSFLKQSKVVAVYNHFGSICGGFCLSPGKISRVIDSLPDEGLNKLNSIPNLHEETIFEVTALWLDRSSKSKLAGVRFWTKLYKEIVRMRRPYFIYAYSSKKKKLGEIYSVAKPIRIFEGFTKLLPGMSCPDHEIIEVAKVSNLHIAWVTNISFMFKRILKKRSTTKREIYH